MDFKKIEKHFHNDVIFFIPFFKLIHKCTCLNSMKINTLILLLKLGLRNVSNIGRYIITEAQVFFLMIFYEISNETNIILCA